ncbi:hypothetical protein E2C01_039889 [Portunus trituberculatus]|uniref:Uncharacterized protein n=1 Tax=Portunus trituberculatus TaxID=210409 RepID=A0A5B7FLD9_PORTR|nr:hypothetical protein [Portunus trituberculatus]
MQAKVTRLARVPPPLRKPRSRTPTDRTQAVTIWHRSSMRDTGQNNRAFRNDLRRDPTVTRPINSSAPLCHSHPSSATAWLPISSLLIALTGPRSTAGNLTRTLTINWPGHPADDRPGRVDIISLAFN